VDGSVLFEDLLGFLPIFNFPSLAFKSLKLSFPSLLFLFLLAIVALHFSSPSLLKLHQPFPFSLFPFIVKFVFVSFFV